MHNPKAIFNLPPKKIIKANANYSAQSVGELSFRKGDFFYVIHDKPDEELYEVINPIEKTRGVVAYRFFQNVARNAAEEAAQKSADQPLQPHLKSPQNLGKAGSRTSYDYWNSQNGGAGKRVEEWPSSSRSPVPVSAPASSLPPVPSYDRYGSKSAGAYQEQQNGGYQDDYYDGASDYYATQDLRDQKDPYRDDESYYEAPYEKNRDTYYDDQGRDDYGVDDYYRNSEYQEPPLPPIPASSQASRNLSGSIRTGDPSDIESCLVQSCTISKDKWYFVLHIKTFSGRLDIIKRSYDDIWALQVTLLTRFPTESGHNQQPRSIPFLTPP
ncbi:bud emergence protein 1, partial [Kappamyces sp. JEL0680]